MARPHCVPREAALAKLDAYKKAYPDEPAPKSLLTYTDESGVRRYTVSGHDTRKSSLRAAERYKGTIERARRNELRLRVALDAVSMFCFEWDIVEDKVSRFDPRKLDLSTTPGAFAHFEAVLNAVHPDDQSRFRADILCALTEPEVDFATQVRVLNPDGSTSWYSERGKVERDPNGRPLRMIGVVVDVTAQKTAGEFLAGGDCSEGKFLAT
jgi:PAS domain-containing protein